jgi:hypothetical protein
MWKAMCVSRLHCIVEQRMEKKFGRRDKKLGKA